MSENLNRSEKEGADQTGAGAVSIVDASKVFGSGDDRVVALNNVSLEIRENEFFTLLGPSGCGKTTLLRLIAGFEQPSSGSIRLYGDDIAHLPPFQRPVNTVFQSYALFPHMTVSQNIGFGLEMLGMERGGITASVTEMLGLVRMESMADRSVSQLSGGQQQRVALARALAPKPKVLLLDEPLSALDLKLRKEMQIELKRLQHETGITFIFVTHDQEEALTMSDRIAVMESGDIRQVGRPREIYDHPAMRFVANFIGETNFLEGELLEAVGDLGRVRLESGVVVDASLPGDEVRPGAVNLVIRPEHAELVEDIASGDISGHISNVVYFGTDTHYHLELPGGRPFVVRMQNLRDRGSAFREGVEVGVLIKENSVQILRD